MLIGFLSDSNMRRYQTYICALAKLMEEVTTCVQYEQCFRLRLLLRFLLNDIRDCPKSGIDLLVSL